MGGDRIRFELKKAVIDIEGRDEVVGNKMLETNWKRCKTENKRFGV